MKYLIVVACALACASAGYVTPVATYWAGAQHLPVIGADGVPVDTAEVQHAKAAHLAHKIEAHARNGDYAIYANAPVIAAAPVVAAGVPLETPEVVAAKINHFAAHAEVAARDAHFASPVISHVAAGVPLETPEVVAAKINHFAAHAEVVARNAHHVLYRKRRSILAAAPVAYTAQHIPVIGANGVPVDTAEVQIAKAAHLAHKVEAHVRNGNYVTPVVSAAPVVSAYAAPWAHQAYSYAAPWAHQAYAAPWAHQAYAAPWAYHY